MLFILVLAIQTLHLPQDGYEAHDQKSPRFQLTWGTEQEMHTVMRHTVQTLKVVLVQVSVVFGVKVAVMEIESLRQGLPCDWVNLALFLHLLAKFLPHLPGTEITLILLAKTHQRTLLQAFVKV